MAIDTDVLNRDLTNIVADLPTTMDWESQSVSVVSGSERSDDSFAENGGYITQRVRNVQTNVDRFTDSTVPSNNDQVTIDEVTYRVSESTKDSQGIMWSAMLKRDLS